MAETKKQRQERLERAKAQKDKLGYVSLKNRVSPDRIRLCMELSGGNSHVLCALLKCTYREFYVLIQHDDELRELWKDIRESIVSQAEGVMATLMDSKNERMRYDAAKYILDKRGKDLGYGQQQTQLTVETTPDGVSIKQIFGIPEQ